MVGDRLLSFNVSTWTFSPRITEWRTQKVDPLHYLHHIAGRQPISVADAN